MAGKVRHGGSWGREEELATLARRQHGVVARRQLEEIGVAERTIERWLSVGRLHRLHRGAYAVGHDRVGARGRRLAAVLACDPDAFLSHRTAAALWGFAGNAREIDITSPRGNQGRARMPGIRLHRCRLHHDEEMSVRDGIPTSSVARTLLDLAEAVSPSSLAHAWEEADRLRLLRLSEVTRVCERARGRRGLRPIRKLLTEAPAPTATRSPLEDRVVSLCREFGLPAPMTNVEILGREVDAYWPVVRLIVEADSFEFHRHRAAFERDRARDAAMQAAGYRVVRLTHRRLEREPEIVASQLRSLLAPG
jgi:hypothetical protein